MLIVEVLSIIFKIFTVLSMGGKNNLIYLFRWGYSTLGHPCVQFHWKFTYKVSQASITVLAWLAWTNQPFRVCNLSYFFHLTLWADLFIIHVSCLLFVSLKNIFLTTWLMCGPYTFRELTAQSATEIYFRQNNYCYHLTLKIFSY